MDAAGVLTTPAEENGLDYFGARYFSGAMGRFTSADPPLVDQFVEDPQSWNLYAYGRNNPLRYVDPTGQAVCSYDNGSTPEGGGATTEEACTGSGGMWLYQPTDTDDPYADASAFQFSTTVRERAGALDAKGQTVVNQLGENADSSMALIGTVAAGSTAIGGGAGLYPVAAQGINQLAFGPATGRVFYHFSRITAAGATGRLVGGTSAGRLWEFVSRPLPPSIQDLGWRLLSGSYASGAGGNVNVFPEVGRRVGTLYQTELPRLINNPSVSSIRYR